MRRHHVERIGADVLELELRGQRPRVDVDQLAVGSVLDHALVRAVPRRGEQRLFRLHILVCIEYQHLGFRFALLEVERDLARALVGSGCAAIGCARHVDGKHAAVGHRFELPAQRRRFASRFPCMEDPTPGLRASQARERFVHEIDARCDDEAIIVQGGTGPDSDAALHRIDIERFIAHQL